jgi:hypothetical protein
MVVRVQVLLDAAASLSARDRRGRAALDYAPAGRLRDDEKSQQMQVVSWFGFWILAVCSVFILQQRGIVFSGMVGVDVFVRAACFMCDLFAWHDFCCCCILPLTEQFMHLVLRRSLFMA